MPPPPAPAATSRSTAARTSSTVTPSRHGWPTTGQARARQPAHGTSTCSSACGTPHGRQRTAGTVGAKSDTTGVPTAAARCAGPVLPTTIASAPASTPASSASVVARRGRSPRAAPATARSASRSAGPPVTTTSRPRSSSAATSAALRSGAHARAGTRGARVHDHVRARGSRAAVGAADAQAPSSPRRQREAGGGGEASVALDLVDVVGIVVAEVEQRAGVVDRDRADPRHVGEAQQQRGRQRALVEGAEDQRRGRSPARRARRRSASDVGAVDRRGLGVDPRRAPDEHLVDAGQQLAPPGARAGRTAA